MTRPSGSRITWIGISGQVIGAPNTPAVLADEPPVGTVIGAALLELSALLSVERSPVLDPVSTGALVSASSGIPAVSAVGSGALAGSAGWADGAARNTAATSGRPKRRCPSFIVFMVPIPSKVSKCPHRGPADPVEGLQLCRRPTCLISIYGAGTRSGLLQAVRAQRIADPRCSIRDADIVGDDAGDAIRSRQHVLL